MSSQTIAFFATIILLMPIGYLFLAAPAFLLVRLTQPTVTQLLRGMFKGYFVMLMVVSPVVVILFAAANHTAIAFVMALLAVFAFFLRRWFLENMDGDLARIARGNGSAAEAARHLRRLHVGGMAVNGILLVTVISGIQLLV